MDTEAALDRAQIKICRALRHELIGSRATLPFDPDDPPDVRAWLRRQLATSSSKRYVGTVAYAANALYLDALTTARKSRRHTDHRKTKPLAMAGLEALAAIAGKPPWWDGWPEALEWVAGLMTGAALHVVDGSLHAQTRKAVAMLSCLGRTVAVIKGSFASRISDDYVGHILRSADYLALPLMPEHRTSFRSALMVLSAGDNLRRVLSAAHLPWAGVKQWQEFQRAAQHVATLRDGREFQFGEVDAA